MTGRRAVFVFPSSAFEMSGFERDLAGFDPSRGQSRVCKVGILDVSLARKQHPVQFGVAGVVAVLLANTARELVPSLYVLLKLQIAHIRNRYRSEYGHEELFVARMIPPDFCFWRRILSSGTSFDVLF
jgi:hypothetical protein